HPIFAAASSGNWCAERGYIKGFVDIVFDHQGLVHFADWKSDLLADYGEDAIAGHVARHYELQARIYAVGVVRTMRIADERDYERRFGGLLYLFLRGIGKGSDGAYFRRPRWPEIDEYQGQLMSDLSAGSTRLPVTGPQSRRPMADIIGTLCSAEYGEAPEAIAARIDCLLEAGFAPHVIGRAEDSYAPLVYLAPFLYQHRMLAAETRLAIILAARLRDSSAPDLDERTVHQALADVVSRPSRIGAAAVELSSEQQDAIAQAAGSKFTVISGAPGTGKTFIVVGLLRVLTRLGISPDDIALAAPTGKAAYRLGESI